MQLLPRFFRNMFCHWTLRGLYIFQARCVGFWQVALECTRRGVHDVFHLGRLCLHDADVIVFDAQVCGADACTEDQSALVVLHDTKRLGAVPVHPVFVVVVAPIVVAIEVDIFTQCDVHVEEIAPSTVVQRGDDALGAGIQPEHVKQVGDPSHFFKGARHTRGSLTLHSHATSSPMFDENLIRSPIAPHVWHKLSCTRPLPRKML